ncbi:hypothetical protein P154DRAFT_578885 [Amniculicola lignicola CBS 123094]|uniref:F-box domain-containing protein n=1 Tax=Amniculicola lignicola CBS 123094 TaxID=1392246 RepID=A0A6A5W9C6_9PLEO|nr:hypothetical protein P154DRAFT_578885 [Amniculicola lignicola CBS 123094]
MASEDPNNQDSSAEQCVTKFEVAESESRSESKPLRRLPSGFFDVAPSGEYLSIATKNAAESPLLRLPPEIRNRIFGYAMTYDHFMCARQTMTGKLDRLLSLQRVCRQTYAETTLSFFQNNTFYFFEKQEFVSCAKQLPTGARKAIKSVEKFTPVQANFKPCVAGSTPFPSFRD